MCECTQITHSQLFSQYKSNTIDVGMSQSNDVQLDDDENRKWPAMQRCEEFYTRYRSVVPGSEAPGNEERDTSDNKDKKPKKGGG